MSERWKPGYMETYYTLKQHNGKCVVIEREWTDHPLNSLDYAQGKCFRKRGEADKACDIMNGDVKHKTE